MKLEEAERLAFKVEQAITPCCERVVTVGSIRRRQPEVADIDLVVIPKPLMWSRIAGSLIQELDATLKACGPQLMRLTIPVAFTPSGVCQVDIYAATPKTWGVLMLIRTGSIEHNIKLCVRAKDLGLRLSAKEGVIEVSSVVCGLSCNRTVTRVIASRTEEEIFKALQMEYVPPAYREV